MLLGASEWGRLFLHLLFWVLHEQLGALGAGHAYLEVELLADSFAHAGAGEAGEVEVSLGELLLAEGALPLVLDAIVLLEEELVPG